MFRKYFCLFCFILCVSVGFSQVSTDPRDPLYEDIVIWENLGIVKNLSPVRPYPLQVIKEILTVVMDSSFPLQSSRAQEYYERIFKKPVSVGIEYKLRSALPDERETVLQNNIGALFYGDFFLADTVSLSLDLHVFATDAYNGAVLPVFKNPPEDAPWDPVDMGKFTGLLDMNMSGAYVLDSLYVQGGVTRNSWGPFYDSGITLSPSSFHSGNINVYYNGSDLWNYQHSFFILGATDNRGKDISPEKFMVLHAIEFNPLSWLSFSYYENIIYGNRFDPVYFLPAPFMVAQSLGSYRDNLQMGITFEVRPFSGFLWATDVLVDDLSVNELVKFDFDTKIKVAAITGIQYAFNTSIVKLITFDYTLIAPYMYTHEDGSGINYQNYTNNGISMGSELLPNSDRISLRLSLEPLKNLSIIVKGSFARHANINESVPDDVALAYLANYGGSNVSVTDGGIHNYANDGRGYLTYAQENFMFMDQDTKMLIVQTGFDTEYTFYTKKAGSITAVLGWTFEYIKNNGVQRSMFNQKIVNPVIADVEANRSAWKAALFDSIANYLSFSVRYTY